MARIRSIKPEIRTSEKVNSWPVEIRYFWILLWGYTDDHGKGRDNARLIVADSYPLDDSVTAEMVEGWMSTLADDGVIVRYETPAGRFFAIRNWGEHQRPSHPAKSVIPDPPEDSGNPPETLAKVSVNGSPEQRAESSRAESRGATERGSRISQAFEVTEAMRAWAKTETPLVDVDKARVEFIDYWLGIPGAKGVKADWLSTWRNNMRRKQEFAVRNSPPKPAVDWMNR